MFHTFMITPANPFLLYLNHLVEQYEIEGLFEQFKSLATTHKGVCGIDKKTFQYCLGPIGLEYNLIPERLGYFFFFFSLTLPGLQAAQRSNHGTGSFIFLTRMEMESSLFPKWPVGCQFYAKTLMNRS